MTGSRRCATFLLVFVLVGHASGNFGDYVDPTFQCPAMTTCPVVCVFDAAECPASLSCQDGTTLCADGSCADLCSSDLVSPCEEPFPLVACPKVIDYMDPTAETGCLAKYQESYDSQNQYAADVKDSATRLTFMEPIFIFCYIWIPAIAMMIVGWWAYNQIWSVVPGSTRPLQNLTSEESKNAYTQTAYKNGVIGTSIYFLVLLTLVGFQVLLLIITLSYYQHDDVDVKVWAPVVEDEEQILLCFIIVWMVGLIFSFTLRVPQTSLSSLFLRRSNFGDASQVAICNPQKRNSEVYYLHVLKSGDELYFDFQFRRYNFDRSLGEFVPGEWIVGKTIGELVEAKGGLSDSDVETRLSTIGPNSIRMKTPNYFKSLMEEFSGIFYVYQNYVIWAWVPLYYYYMAIIYCFVVLAGGITVAFFRYLSEVKLHQMALKKGTVEARRNGEFQTIDQEDLVPGDVIILKPGITFCDMVVLQDTTLVLDESALTGESTPLSKTSIDPADESVSYDPKIHKRQTILAGTYISECSATQADLGLVIKTGSFTSKGEMLREILSFTRHKFKFDREIKIVLIILFVYGLFGFTMTGFVLIKESWIYGWFYGVYVFACCVPPLLPTVFVVSVGISDNRLLKKRIACSNSESILVAGKVNKALFDKTGTLTKQGLDFLSARSRENWNNGKEISISGFLATGMTCCHTLSQMGDGTLIGNSVDKTMFEAVGGTMIKTVDQSSGTSLLSVSNSNGENVYIFKQFDFDHHRMTQSVIVKTQGKTYGFVKGSAESIHKLCNQNSLPTDFEAITMQSAREGIYQISLAVKEIGSNWQDISRSELESNLNFIGLVNFKNILRDETVDVIAQLKIGAVDPVMITGDSVLTGIHIAKECRIIESEVVLIGSKLDAQGAIMWVDESGLPAKVPSIENVKSSELGVDLVISGPVWKSILENNRSYGLDLIEHIRVVGRCTPNDKMTFVNLLGEKGYITLMCGDGANDSGALKAAHVGVALSDSEASIVSPFTSLDKTISSVSEVLREGRCAMASAIASYKYMIMYGQIEAINQMINAYFQVTFGEWCWVFMDGVWVICMAFALPLARAAKTLAPSRPTASILGPHTLSSVLGVLALNFLFTVFALMALFHQDWYQCRKWGSTDVSNVGLIVDNFEAETVFLVTGYQYISSAMAYNFGYVHREAWIQNYLFVSLALGFTIIHFYITLVPSKLSCFFRINCVNEDVVRGVTSTSHDLVSIQNPFHTTVMPVNFRWILVVIMVCNTISIIGYDYFFVNGIFKKLGKKWE